MATYQIQVKSGTMEWSEDVFDHNVVDDATAQAAAKGLIERFNDLEKWRYGADAGLRELLSCRFVGDLVPTPHQWEKTNAVTRVRANGQSFDTYRCQQCRITGRRFGLGGSIVRDDDSDPEFCNP
jgi:hypothetical protein